MTTPEEVLKKIIVQKTPYNIGFNERLAGDFKRIFNHHLLTDDMCNKIIVALCKGKCRSFLYYDFPRTKDCLKLKTNQVFQKKTVDLIFETVSYTYIDEVFLILNAVYALSYEQLSHILKHTHNIDSFISAIKKPMDIKILKLIAYSHDSACVYKALIVHDIILDKNTFCEICKCSYKYTKTSDINTWFLILEFADIEIDRVTMTCILKKRYSDIKHCTLYHESTILPHADKIIGGLKMINADMDFFASLDSIEEMWISFIIIKYVVENKIKIDKRIYKLLTNMPTYICAKWKELIFGYMEHIIELIFPTVDELEYACEKNDTELALCIIKKINYVNKQSLVNACRRHNLVLVTEILELKILPDMDCIKALGAMAEPELIYCDDMEKTICGDIMEKMIDMGLVINIDAIKLLLKNNFYICDFDRCGMSDKIDDVYDIYYMNNVIVKEYDELFLKKTLHHGTVMRIRKKLIEKKTYEKEFKFKNKYFYYEALKANDTELINYLETMYGYEPSIECLIMIDTYDKRKEYYERLKK